MTEETSVSRSGATDRERQDALLDALRSRPSLTIWEAWYVGHELGLYVGGDAPLVKSDLMALCRRHQARRHDGFCRAISEDERRRAKRWADYWTLR